MFRASFEGIIARQCRCIFVKRKQKNPAPLDRVVIGQNRCSIPRCQLAERVGSHDSLLLELLLVDESVQFTIPQRTEQRVARITRNTKPGRSLPGLCGTESEFYPTLDQFPHRRTVRQMLRAAGIMPRPCHYS